jgi:hypothetical protein
MRLLRSRFDATTDAEMFCTNQSAKLIEGETGRQLSSPSFFPF